MSQACKRILVEDDERDVNRSLKIILEKCRFNVGCFMDSFLLCVVNKLNWRHVKKVKFQNRGSASIKEINISPENRQFLEKIVKNGISNIIKKQIKQLIGGSPCCVCYGIPDYEVIYSVSNEPQNAPRVQCYCKDCIKKVYEWEQVLNLVNIT